MPCVEAYSYIVTRGISTWTWSMHLALPEAQRHHALLQVPSVGGPVLACC